MHEAMLYSKNKDKSVSCFLCNRFCIIPENEKGFCGVRKNIDGTLYSLVYGKAIAMHLDPIEKKPFYHFMPGNSTYSFSTIGCNFRCKYCQNWDISQHRGQIIGEDLSPKQIVQNAQNQNAEGIAYTYTEPTIFMEYALDTAKLARKNKLFNVFVTNGYMTPAAIDEMKPLIDASRIDLKGFNQKIYKEVVGDAKLEAVLQSIKLLNKTMHIEIINLVIPGMNDSEDELRALSKWVADLDKNIPIHFIGFYPSYKMMDTPATPLNALRKARELAIEEGIRYAYTGNRMDPESESTFCYNCNELLVKRYGFQAVEINLKKDCKCPNCGKKQYFVMNMEDYWKRK
ncbi:AmmeMemoRadiSam system radical SAM enzyme [Candidatus Micrarchaeota archaeon]|nr:AmmeMemoRadiSam system radical SAM enzyme [Candidatus Micrarchaeota archaeon]